MGTGLVRLLTLLLLAAGAWMLYRRIRKMLEDLRQSTQIAPPQQQGQEVRMVRCAHCGLHIPQHEALSDNGILYCSEAHRRLGANSDNTT
jgi:uncharacterized protein